MLDNVLKTMKRELLEDIRSMLREELQQFKAEPTKQSDELMDTRSVCKYLGISAPTLRRFVREGHLQAYRIQTTIRYKRSEVEKALTNVRYLKHARKPI